MEEERDSRVSVIAKIASFLFPLIGVICYFVQRDRVEDPNQYLYYALVGFLLTSALNFFFL